MFNIGDKDSSVPPYFPSDGPVWGNNTQKFEYTSTQADCIKSSKRSCAWSLAFVWSASVLQSRFLQYCCLFAKELRVSL